MVEFKLAALPSWVKHKGAFTDDCVLQLTPEAQAAGERGQFKLTIVHKVGKRPIKGIRLTLGMLSGHLSIALGGDDHTVDFAAGTTGHYDIRLWRSSRISVGPETTSNGVRIICDHSDVVIGEDCMFSDEILLQAADQHPLIDLTNGEVINNVRRRTELADHVWIGRGATLMPDVSVGRGAIVGTDSVVTRSVPATSVVAGVPARVVRSDTTWSRQFGHMDRHAKLMLKERGLRGPGRKAGAAGSAAESNPDDAPAQTDDTGSDE